MSTSADRLTIQSYIWAATDYMFEVLGIGRLLAWGTVVPAAGSTGYGKGCIFIHVDGATDDALLYVNTGSTTVANFAKLSSVWGATADTIASAITFTSTLKTAGNVGVAESVSGVTVTEYGDGVFHKTVFTFTNAAIALTDAAGVVAWIGQKLYTFPQGFIYMQSAVLDLALTLSAAGVNADWDGDIAVGTAVNGEDGTLATTEQDIIPATATPQAAASATTGDAVSTATEHKIHDGTSAAKALYLNVLVDDTDHDVTSTPTNMIFNGTLTVCWVHMGDN